jgi:hypothetical protein
LFQRQQQQQQNHKSLPFATIMTRTASPNYDHKPFFSTTFCCPIAIGSTFIFDTRPNKDNKTQQLVGRIIKACKAPDEDDFEVTVNVFRPFGAWPPRKTLFPIKEGLGKNLQEVVLTSRTATFYFDRDVFDVAFMFTTMELSKRGAILQGIDNVFVCRYHDNEEVVKDGELVPFPSMMKGYCPVPQCFIARLFLDIEALRSQIYADLNRRGEQQGELTKTFNHVPFTWESWRYFKFKLSDRLGIPVVPLTNRFFLHRLTHDMKRTKFAVSEDVDVMRFSDESQLISLRSVLGLTICYGIRASRARLGDTHPRQIPPGCAVNCVVVPDAPDEDNNPSFIRVPAACQGGFDLIHNGKNVLSLRSRYRKFHFETKDGDSIPLDECDLPQHFQDILKPQNWGFWQNQGASIKKGALFDHERRLYIVTDVFDDRVEAKPMFTGGLAVSFYNKNELLALIARKQGVAVN